MPPNGKTANLTHGDTAASQPCNQNAKSDMFPKEISKEIFYSHNVLKNSLASAIREESNWFEDNENNLLGTIFFDKFDKDWGYVILALDSDGGYRAIEEVNASLESEEHAEHELIMKMVDLGVKGEVKEELYRQEVNELNVSVTDINEELKKYFKKYPEKLYDLSSRKFEELVASILQDFGFRVELTKSTRDGGSDIIASIKNAITSFLLLVECKKYSQDNKVGVGIIREVAGVHTLRQPSKSIIVTTSFFTNDAIKEAHFFKEQLELKDYNALKGWLNRY